LLRTVDLRRARRDYRFGEISGTRLKRALFVG
jgi:hypothetical protein